MNVVWLVILHCSAALAGWVEAGPERGHVLDAAVGETRASVATRVGVVSADAGLTAWARDPRFPPEVRRLAYGPGDVAWGAPAGQLWRIGERTERVVFFESQTSLVDLATTGSGALGAAARGAEAGVLRVEGSEAARVVEGVDAWCVDAADARVVVGTVDGAVLESTDDGRSFAAVLEADAGISAVAILGEDLWVGLADGGVQVQRDGAWVELDPVQGGYVSGFASAGGTPVATVQRLQQGHDALLAYTGDWAKQIRPGRLGDDTTVADLTGAWSMPDGRALVGSFRRGPLVYDGASLGAARDGFRATVTGGAATDSGGRIVLALMGTGVYLSKDAGGSWASAASGDGPVTDSVEVTAIGDELAVVDFEGVAILDAQGHWRRLPRNPHLSPGQNPASVGRDADGAFWVVDRVGALFRLEGQSWEPCQQRGLRLDGDGEDLLLATQGGFLKPGACDEAWAPYELEGSPSVDGRHARSAGGWVVGTGGVWRDGARRFDISQRPVRAVAARGDELLIALEDGAVLRCGDACDAVGEPAPGGAVAALGWLPDGRVWAAEATGTFLIHGEGPSPDPWTTVRDARRVTGDLMPLERAPWNDESAPQGPRGHVAPGGQPPGHQPGQPQHGPPPQGGPQHPPLPGDEPPTPQAEPGCGCGGAAPAGSLLASVALLGVRRRRRS